MKPRGFTSVEVLAATALAALLMAAVLGVMAGMTRHERLAAKRPFPAWLDRCEALLTCDLSAASEIRASSSERFAVVTISARRGGVGGPTWLPVEVDYFIAQRADVRCLLRQERPRTLPGELGEAEVVATGVSAMFALTALSGDPQVAAARGDIVSVGRMPSQLRIVLIGAQADTEQETLPVIFDAPFATH